MPTRQEQQQDQGQMPEAPSDAQMPDEAPGDFPDDIQGAAADLAALVTPMIATHLWLDDDGERSQAEVEARADAESLAFVRKVKAMGFARVARSLFLAAVEIAEGEANAILAERAFATMVREMNDAGHYAPRSAQRAQQRSQAPAPDAEGEDG